MNRVRVFAGLGVAVALGLALTGCSIDTAIWGDDGARVIETTDHVAQEVVAGTTAPLACSESDADFGEPGRWAGLSAGEPERLDGSFWQEQQLLGAEWTINLSGLDTTTAENGGSYPSYIFFREIGDELCVIDIEWGTVTY